ncbi:MAG: DUF4390 domain-containing protein [bacterium]
MLKRLGLSLLAMMMLPVGSSAASEAPDSVDYDIFRRDGLLMVRLDLSLFLSVRRVDHLKEGIDFVIEYSVGLTRPRRFRGAEKITGITGSVRIGYSMATDDYWLTPGQHSPEKEQRFSSLAFLHQYLADSVQISVVDSRQLSRHHRYRLRFELSCIALIDFNLAAKPGKSAESPIKFLFRQFLRLTGFGSQETSAETRSFSPAEIRSED